MFDKLKQKWNRLFPQVPFAPPYWDLREFMTIFRLAVTGEIVEGQAVSRLEQRMSEFLGRRYCIGVNLGRSALELALRGVGCESGDEVIMPSYCCRSVLSAVLKVGCRPVFADVADDLNLDPDSVIEKLSSRTRAMIVAHMFGSPAAIDTFEKIAADWGIALIDDAAQSFGGEYLGRRLGSFGDAGIVSFGPGKTVTATGGGVFVTDRDDVAERVRSIQLGLEPYTCKLRQSLDFAMFRWLRRYTAGWKTLKRRVLPSGPRATTSDEFPLHKLSNVDAVIALLQLEKLDRGIHRRRRHADYLCEKLTCIDRVESLRASPSSTRTKFVAMLATSDPQKDGAELRARFADCGIEVWPNYVPLHELPEVKQYRNGSLPRTEDLAKRAVFLPNDPWMREADVARVANCCSKFFRELV